ncbi:MAG: winged helix-turn-helix domain-containing protein [Coriobacteriia bacterium]
MKTNELYAELLDAVLESAWQQWTAIGLAGIRADNRTVVDPEALILATLEVARSDARLFDEALDWMARNSGLVDVSRLRRLGKGATADQRRLLGIAAQIAGLHGAGPTLRRLPEEDFIAREAQPTYGAQALFRTPLGPEGAWYEPDAVFANAGYLRSRLELRGMSQRPPGDTPAGLRFRARGLVGIGPRAEVLTYLWTHEWGHGREIAARAAYGQAPVAEYLSALADSGLAERRIEGRRTLYRLSAALRDLGRPAPRYVDWTRAWPALTALLEALRPSALSEDAVWIDVYHALDDNEEGLRSEGLGVEVGDLRGWARKGTQVLERAVAAVIERVQAFGK